ncbi:hypothetical protein ABZ572_02635 [Streptomyces sp. NPDC018338]|uniref:hypothetical protein n=1 Tax=Streptomyces sp. NPDC018338 TaxID=3157192 RepID=UPI0033EAA12F
MRKISIAVSSIVAAVIAVSTAGSASAYPGPTTRCYPYMACFYFNSNQAGAIATMGEGEYNLDDQIFTANTGAGAGTYVENNAASADSRETSLYYCIHRDRWWSGPYDVLPAQYKMNLVDTYNKNSSTTIYHNH